MLYDEILGRTEPRIHERRTGRGGASIQVAVQPESVSSAVGERLSRMAKDGEGWRRMAKDGREKW